GYSWKEHKFTQSTERVRVYDITTYPSGNSSKFLLRGSYEGDLSKEVVIYLDLSAMLPNKCNEDDFEGWIPTHSEETGCFFGKKYYRKISDRICRIDEIKHPEELDATCSCTVQDYE
ncbi:14933_t:CDS:2, partial [Dentiscutata heterogama]